jgi:hypothetical protein
MIINFVLLLFTTGILYFGYTYSGIVMFFYSMLYEDIKNWFDRISKSNATYNNKTKSWNVTFYIDKKPYSVIVPEDQLNISKHKILAMSNRINVTERFLQSIGPLMNFWGLNVTPRNFGLEYPLIVWTKGYQYIFPLDNYIIFNDKYIVIDSESSSSEEELIVKSQCE